MFEGVGLTHSLMNASSIPCSQQAMENKYIQKLNEEHHKNLASMLNDLADYVNGIAEGRVYDPDDTPSVETINFSKDDDRIAVDLSKWNKLEELANVIQLSVGNDWCPILSSATLIIPGSNCTKQAWHRDLDLNGFEAGVSVNTMLMPISRDMGFTFGEGGTNFDYKLEVKNGELTRELTLTPYEYVWFDAFECVHRGLPVQTPRLFLEWMHVGNAK